MIQEQLDEGLRSIQHSANSLMHEIAGEVWRSAGGDKEAVASTILKELSRDQAIRALIAHSDERFQALASRTGRLEDTMNMLAESVRSAREQISRSADALAESGAGSPLGVGQIRAQIDEVSRQVAGAFKTLADRDQEIVETSRPRSVSTASSSPRRPRGSPRRCRSTCRRASRRWGGWPGARTPRCRRCRPTTTRATIRPGDRWISRSPSSPNTCSSCTTGPGSR